MQLRIASGTHRASRSGQPVASAHHSAPAHTNGSVRRASKSSETGSSEGGVDRRRRADTAANAMSRATRTSKPSPTCFAALVLISDFDGPVGERCEHSWPPNPGAHAQSYPLSSPASSLQLRGGMQRPPFSQGDVVAIAQLKQCRRHVSSLSNAPALSFRTQPDTLPCALPIAGHEKRADADLRTLSATRSSYHLHGC